VIPHALALLAVTVSKLGVPREGERMIREERIDVVMPGRSEPANPHGRVRTARESGHEAPSSLVPEVWRWRPESSRNMDRASARPRCPPHPAGAPDDRVRSTRGAA
jgi:hypothetical protein